MSNKLLTIIMFSDDDHDVTVVDTILFTAGLSLAGKATDPRTREQLIEAVKSKKISPDIIIIDTYQGKNHADGSNIATVLKPFADSAKILAYTTLPEEQEWADFTGIKGSQDLDKSLLSGLKVLGELNFNLDNTPDPEKNG